MKKIFVEFIIILAFCSSVYSQTATTFFPQKNSTEGIPAFKSIGMENTISLPSFDMDDIVKEDDLDESVDEKAKKKKKLMAEVKYINSLVKQMKKKENGSQQ